jgi:DHA1 family bicyclomycin/chloramphenicol resistance-like MFS transporter
MLGSIGALVPAAIDLYLASLPRVAGNLHASTGTVQLTMTLFVLVLGVGQLIGGPVSDSWGRRWPLRAGLAVLAVGSVAAAVAPSVEVLIAARVVQAAGAAMAYVVVVSMIRDLESGPGAARMFAMMTTLAAAAPVLAPLIGGVISEWFGWRWVFVLLAALTAALLAVVWRGLPETRPRSERHNLHLGRVLHGYAGLFGDRVFVLLLATFMAISIFLFIYITGSPFVFEGHYGLSPSVYGLVYGLSGIAIVIAARLVPRVIRGIGVVRTSHVALVVVAVAAALMVIEAVTGASLWVLVATIAAAEFGLGLCEAPMMTRAMDQSARDHGVAAALVGSVAYGGGALSSVVVAITGVGHPVVWTVSLLVVAAAAALLGLLAGASRRRVARPARPKTIVASRRGR